MARSDSQTIQVNMTRFQLNFMDKNRWWAGFGQRVIVCLVLMGTFRAWSISSFVCPSGQIGFGGCNAWVMPDVVNGLRYGMDMEMGNVIITQVTGETNPEPQDCSVRGCLCEVAVRSTRLRLFPEPDFPLGISAVTMISIFFLECQCTVDNWSLCLFSHNTCEM